MTRLRIIAVVLLVILVCLMAVTVITGNSKSRQEAGYVEKAETGVNALDILGPLIIAGSEVTPRRKAALQSKNLVVDTLNLAHWLRRRAPLKKVDLCDILSAIDESAPIIRKKYTGRIIYVTKDRESPETSVEKARSRALYQSAARRNGVYVDVVERLPTDIARSSSSRRKPHSGLGRDDFYLIVKSWKLNCPVLSRDRFRDLSEMKGGHLEKFRVYSYSPFTSLPSHDYVNPTAVEFAHMGRPVTVDYSEVLPSYH
jgi:hypothetical protein